MTWRGRTALVTGASRGIGRAVALGLAAEGARVGLMARDTERLTSAAAACREAGAPDPVVVPADVTDADAVQHAVDEAVHEFDDGLDLLANVAGAGLRDAPIEELADDDWRAVWELNFLACARLQRLCHEALRRSQGAVVHVGSIVGARAMRRSAPYAAAKSALASLARSTAVEWSRDGIRCVTVEPGFVDTDFNAALTAAGADQRLLERVPTKQPIEPEEIARTVLFVGSPDNRQLTGTTVRIDGGWTGRL